ncbi:MAG: outer membrane beta-barrel protein [Ferruginibacter sp.]
MLNAGLRQSLLKKKLNVTLTASDIFKTLRQRSEINTIELQQVAVSRRGALVVYIGAALQLGKILKKQKEETIQFDNAL